MRPKISLLGLFIAYFFLLSCGGGGGGGNDTVRDTQINAQSNFIQVKDENYTLKQITETEISIPGQHALLPNGNIVFADVNFNRISIIIDETVKVIADEDNIDGWNVCTLPDGRICYSLLDGQLILIDPNSKIKHYFSSIPNGARVSALAADEFGNIYAATSHFELYRFRPDGVPIKLVDNLPYDVDWAIFDLEVDRNGIIYVAGFNRVVRITPEGSVEIIAGNLNYEPVWVEVAIDGSVYINDAGSGLQRYNDTNGQLEYFKPDGFWPQGDILFTDDNKIIIHESATYYEYDLSTNTVIPLVVIVNNSSAFSANANNMLFYATPGKPPILDSHIISLNIDGEKEELFELSFDIIAAANVDKLNHLCLFTNEGFKRVESDQTITTIYPIFENDNQPMGSSNDFAVGPDNNWYVISSDLDSSIEIYKFDDFGNAIYLPILFNKDTFGGAYRVHDASIDMGDDGRLAIIVTAMGSLGHGPYYQRIYRANSDGSDLIEVANLDSNRIGGMVDIAISSNNDIFVLTVQDRADVIYKITAQSNIITEFIWCEIGHDPESMDVDPNGNVWITTTKGIYVAEPRN